MIAMPNLHLFYIKKHENNTLENKISIKHLIKIIWGPNCPVGRNGLTFSVTKYVTFCLCANLILYFNSHRPIQMLPVFHVIYILNELDIQYIHLFSFIYKY